MPEVIDEPNLRQNSGSDSRASDTSSCTPGGQDHDPADSLMSEDSTKRKSEAAGDGTQSVRRKDSASKTQQFFPDVLLIVPSICFVVYGIVVLKNNGRPIDESPVPALHITAVYSPTIFPIAFAAVAANLLKAIAGWKMERGVTILSLEYLLSCRTVFSAVTTPLSLRRANILAPLLVALWAMSPLGDQAALRIMDATPSQVFEVWPFEYLEFMSVFPHSGAKSPAGTGLMPSILGTFISALSSPPEIKAGPRDSFGNVKIPMLENYPQITTPNSDGWYHVNPDGGGTTWSAIMGLPIATQNGFSEGQNYSFSLNTSYMTADCSVKRGRSMDLSEWTKFMNETQRQEAYTTNKSLVIKRSKQVSQHI